MTLEAFQASTRFGLGAAPGEQDAMNGDPKGWLVHQLVRPVSPPELAGVRSNNEAAIELLNRGRDKKNGESVDRRLIRDAFIDETGTRFIVHQKTTQPFFERLVIFWSNHFTVSTQKKPVVPLANAFEAEAIRPHVTGKFADMLKASAGHPAMLLYLDNAQSIGPNSVAGKRRTKGLNENLAREIMELHTLGVNGGYTQADVTSFANILTGWTLARDDDGVQPRAEFNPNWHEPGSKIFLGKTYKENGAFEGSEALDDLAHHPATANFIAFKLARHFIADDPPKDAVAALAEVFRATDGDMKAVSTALVTLPGCWTPMTKFRTPYEFAVAALRLTGITPTPAQAMNGLKALNYDVFGAASPAGYPDVASAWVSSDEVMKRIDWAQALSERIGVGSNPARLANDAFGPVALDHTKFIIAGAETGKDGLAFLLASPEFQRR